jgi:hypothetical protein
MQCELSGQDVLAFACTRTSDTNPHAFDLHKRHGQGSPDHISAGQRHGFVSGSDYERVKQLRETGVITRDGGGLLRVSRAGQRLAGARLPALSACLSRALGSTSRRARRPAAQQRCTTANSATTRPSSGLSCRGTQIVQFGACAKRSADGILRASHAPAAVCRPPLPGEPFTVALLGVLPVRLARLEYDVPDQDLTISLRRIPAKPHSGCTVIPADARL